MQQHRARKRARLNQHSALVVGVTAVGAVIAGRPMIARSVEKVSNTVQEGVIARSPVLDQALYRADEALNLHLTTAQKAEIKPVLATTARQAMELYNDHELAPATKRARLRVLLESTRRELTPLITGEQRTKLEAAQKDLTTLNLNLTPQQRARLQPIILGVFSHAQAIHADRSLSASQKRNRIRHLLITARAQSLPVLDHRQLQRLAGLFDTPIVTNVLTRELNLDESQQDKVKAIVADATRQMQAVSGDESLSTSQIQRRCYGVLGKAQLQLDEVISPAQQHKLNQLAVQVNNHLKLVS